MRTHFSRTLHQVRFAARVPLGVAGVSILDKRRASASAAADLREWETQYGFAIF